MTYNFDKFCDFLLETFGFGSVLGLLGVTNEKGTAYITSRDGLQSHASLITNGKGNKSAAQFALRTTYNPSENAAWRYSKKSGFLFFWDLAQTSSDLKSEARYFVEKMGYKINGVRDITHTDETYDQAHNFN